MASASEYEDVIVLNEGLEFRTRKSGKTRATFVVKSEPLVFNLDPKTLGAPVAAAIVNTLREKVRGITQVASLATQIARKGYAKAFGEGRPWATSRYDGGKIGATPPAQSDRLFNDSGRFVKSLTGNASKDGAWRINVAANRLNNNAASAIYDKLVSLVPEFGDPARLMEAPAVRAAIETSLKNMIQKKNATSGKLAVELFRTGIELAKVIAEFADVLIDG